MGDRSMSSQVPGEPLFTTTEMLLKHRDKCHGKGVCYPTKTRPKKIKTKDNFFIPHLRLSRYLFIYLHKKPDITTITQIFESADKTII